ncbi:MAG: hypothetical protein JWQ71_4936 [Pedosphaera sp.]|nr:hypothetical protein [Pedosphaera sp.]
MKNPFKKVAGMALAMSLLAGCQTGMLNTATGKPEIIVHQSSTRDIQTAALNFFQQRGYVLSKPDFEFYGTTYPLKRDDLVFERLHWEPINLVGIPSSTRIRLNIRDTVNGPKVVMGDPYNVNNCHYVGEEVVQATWLYPEVQGYLEQIQRRLEPHAVNRTPRTTIVQ